jgi:Tol biopolymer transport system component
MALSAGDRLGPYEILAPLGAGGMGEVYRARDPRLGREVAVKVLPASLVTDEDRLRRFEQEARAVGQLDHPGLLTVFDVGSHDGTPYIVSELLRGETLRARFAGGPLPEARAIELGAQIARGLAAAHAKGIVHRDLKPENLFVTADGRAKILDFGLARVAPGPAAAGAQSQLETLSALTTPGVILGTVGYMSPEQVRGEATDARSDIFSLGVVLYEMLTGRRAFAGASAVETLNAILKEEPSRELPPFVPGGDGLSRVVKRCLEKRREDRFQGADDLAFALELAHGGGTARSGAASGVPTGTRARWPWLVAAAAGLGLASWTLSRGAPPRPVASSPIAQATLTPLTVDPGDEIDPTFAPDNDTLAYASDRSGDYEIYLQKTSGGPAINLTRDPGDDVQPAFSPDGRLIAFVSTRQSRHPLAYHAPRLPLIGGDVWVMPALGGVPRRVAEDGNFPAWSPDGRYVYYLSGTWFRSEIRRVAAGGGAPETLPIRLPGNGRVPFLLSPTVSPDGRWLAFWGSSPARVYLVPLAGGEARRVAAGAYPIFSADGASLLYASSEPGKNHGVWRLPFDTTLGAPSGTAFPLTFGIGEQTAVTLSRDGTKLAVASLDRSVNLEAVPFDADGVGVRGAPVPLTTGSHSVVFFGPSPDGRSAVFVDERGAESHLWRIDQGGSEAFQLTLDPEFQDTFPRWSPDGGTIAFSRRRLAAAAAGGPNPDAGPADEGDLWLISADGASPRTAGVSPGARAVWVDAGTLIAFQPSPPGYARLDLASRTVTPVLEKKNAMPIFDVSQDGRWLAGQSTEHDSVDILAVPLDDSRQARFVVAAPTADYHPFFSPAGRWLYFHAEHKNLFRVPGPAQGWRPARPEQVTQFPERGLYVEEPQISRDGRTLFYARASITGDIWLLRLGGR